MGGRHPQRANPAIKSPAACAASRRLCFVFCPLPFTIVCVVFPHTSKKKEEGSIPLSGEGQEGLVLQANVVEDTLVQLRHHGCVLGPVHDVDLVSRVVQPPAVRHSTPQPVSSKTCAAPTKHQALLHRPRKPPGTTRTPAWHCADANGRPRSRTPCRIPQAAA